ncbi:MAG: hypothetical protein J2P28_02825 [Actinobacteria bacterium]|nr:hypothetical protein [Actinomycetota bacterium]
MSADLAFVLKATGASYRQAIEWRMWGWLHTPTLGTGSAYPWRLELRQIDWLVRLSRNGRVLDERDSLGGYALRTNGARWGIRVGRAKWRPLEHGDLSRALKAGEPFTVAVVVRPEISELAGRKVA